MIPIEVVVDRPGSNPLRLTPSWDSFHFTTAAIGGFAQASFTLPGEPARWKREIPHLGLVRIVLDTFTLWEGQVEDVGLALGGDIGASVNCFGLQRRLDETTVKRIWTKRDMAWAEAKWPAGFVSNGATRNRNLQVDVGAYDIADLTKTGVRVIGTGVSIPTFNANFAEWLAAPAMNITRIMGTVTIAHSGVNNFTGFLHEFVAAWQNPPGTNTWAASTTSIDTALSSGAVAVRIGAFNANAGAQTYTNGDSAGFYDLRLLGTSLTEDASGGFYGGTILRDLIALVPGLTANMIDTGSDYTIQAIERSVRSAARSVVEEIAGYYTREWAVWEDGNFNWETVNRDEPQWMCELSDLQPGSELTSTVDGLAKTVYILYADAADQRDWEASSSSTAQRNPYVKQGKTKDMIVQPGFPMTASTSAQLASRFVGDVGNYPAVQGRLVLPALIPVKRANGPSLPAIQIRGGDNILVTDLPKTDLFATGRDGETLFHIVSTDADLTSGLVTLEIEGQTRRMDVLLARLAAAVPRAVVKT